MDLLVGIGGGLVLAIILVCVVRTAAGGFGLSRGRLGGEY